MKIKDVIAELQKLDQERNIWITYDSEICFCEPIPNRNINFDGNPRRKEYYKRKEPLLQEGDYIIDLDIE